MEYTDFAPLNRTMSRLVLGAGVFSSLEHASEMLDLWQAKGGNAVDTAHFYQEGESERRLGEWIESRGCRDKIIVITKGCHPSDWLPRVTPEALGSDLTESLSRLRTTYIDLYLLHRDDPNVPVGPVLETLNRHKADGRVLAFGASNWTPARLDEAADYAASHGIEGFSCSSPHLSLARQNEPPWPGCVSAWDRASLEWYARKQFPLLAWSSQAGGFFARPTEQADPDIYRTEDNMERLRRVESLAREKGREPVQIALAWVLHQPFPVFALIGPRTPAHLDSSLAGLEIELSRQEIEWLYDIEPSGD